MEQTSFFEIPKPRNRAPLALKSDPTSSHIAAEEITRSGLRDSQKEKILESLRKHGKPVTSLELARWFGIDRYVVARRLPDLERDKLVRRGPMRDCAIARRPAITWIVED